MNEPSNAGNTSVLGVLALLSALTVFVLPGQPERIVFDEVHFVKFVSSYCCTGKRIFDVHPPHGKLLIAGVARTLGYSSSADSLNINDKMASGDSFKLRLLPALAGMLLPLVVFRLLLHLGAFQSTALFAALLLVFDNAFTVQSRLASLDSMLLLFTFTSLMFYFDAARSSGHWRWPLLIICGACAGLAAGVKYTGMLALGMLGVLLFLDLMNALRTGVVRWYQPFISGAVIIAAAFAVFVLGWYLHFQLLDRAGPGDAWGILQGGFWQKFMTVQEQMLRANAGLGHTHHDASAWWQWPLMLKPIYYWASDGAKLYFIGNPLVWWGSTLVLLTVLMVTLLSLVSSLQITATSNRKVLLAVPVIGYLCAYLPLLYVGRILFLYHYLTALVFAIMISALWLQKISWLRDGSLFKQRLSVYGVLALVLLTFTAFIPFTYGTLWGMEWREALLGSNSLWR